MSRRSKGPVRRLLGIALRVVVGCLLAALLIVGGANLITVMSTRDNVHTVSDLADFDADAVVVLGASVKPDGTPSDILQDRLETAVSLYRSGATGAIIVSGDNRTSHYNESAAMKAYCVALGVPSEDVYEDHAGYSTYESMYRARHVFGAERIIVTTQAYHLYRAMFAAQGLGMETRGVASDHGAYDNQRMYSLREVIARTKDFFNTLLQVPVESAHDAAPVNLADSGDLT